MQAPRRVMTHRYLHKFLVATADTKHGLAASVLLPGSWVAKTNVDSRLRQASSESPPYQPQKV
jgi:hypothetical protein